MAQTLTRKRGTLKHKLTIFSKYIDSIKKDIEQGNEIENTIIIELELRLNKFESVLQDFEMVQIEIEATIQEENLQAQFEERESFEQSYFSLMACAKEILNNNKTDNEVNVSPVSSVNGSNRYSSNLKNIKLPTIELPKFSGSYDNWLEFKDKFESLIHNNDAINDVQRYHYLRASLEGTAAQVIQSLDFSALNYPIAWELINNRFENKQLLVNNHIKELFSLTSITRESAANIRQLIDNVYKHLRALKVLKQPIDSWDTLIIFLITTKLDKSTASEWEKQRTQENFPTLEDLTKFLRSRANLLETIEFRDKEPTSNKMHKLKGQRHVTLISNNIKCNFCKGQHLIYYCADFLKHPIYSRIEKIKELKLCMNCLRTGHLVRNCRLSPCKICHRRHNTLLHDKQEDLKNPPKEDESQKSFTSRCKSPNTQVLLSTACVEIMDSNGKYHTAKAILDSGSQSNFISQAFSDKLGLRSEKTNMTIVGFNQVQSNIKSRCQVELQSSNKKYMTNISCFIIPSISDDLPSHPIDIRSWQIPKQMQLADPQFMKPGTIDLLIGAGLFWTLMLQQKYHLGKNNVLLQNTRLGWIVTGTIVPSKQISRMRCNFSVNIDVQEQLKMFWETEEVSRTPAWSNEEMECETHFKTNTTRQSDGRFIVTIPLKESPERLGDSKETALKRFYSLERKFQRNPQFKIPYSLFMKEYEDLNHMTKINQPDERHEQSYFLPHHGVQKLDSTTTKLRVVFDGSAATNTGWSLNDIQAVGPTIQEDLFSIVIRFRQHRYVLSADITKMYRQINVNEAQRYLQRILWRNDFEDEVSIYELNTVTYGTASSSYLAIRCLHQLAEEHQEKHPRISEIIRHDFYVDDLLTGADTSEELVKIYNDISTILNSGCFELRKWISNNKGIVFKENDSTTMKVLQFGTNEHTKTLGIRWCSNSDYLIYRINEAKPTKVTKRSILSDIAQIFDPLGLVCPCVILAKIMLQQLWLLKLEWDDSIPPVLTNRWNKFRQSLPILNELTIPRFIFVENYLTVELHGFCDASQEAYGACIYARSKNAKDEIQVRLICAKSKVAPLKTITIPKLELNGALLLANLMHKVRESLTVKANLYYWSDSQVTLAWINTQPNLLLPFVSNRVSRIQDLTATQEWQYVPTRDNPADLVSRGVYPDQLLRCNNWWEGPDWLSRSRDHWPKEKFQLKENLPELKKRAKVLISIESKEEIPFGNYSSYKKLKRVIAFALRFINNCRNKDSRLTGSMTIDELGKAEKCIIKVAQRHSFNKEIQVLASKKQLDKGNKLLSLTPFLDSAGIIRVGGRLKMSTFTQDKKHPFLLHAKHQLSKLIFSDEHIKLLHAGPQQTMASTREKFWIIAGRSLARKTIKLCVKCFRFNPKQVTPLMGNLPNHRLNFVHPFYATGVDYAGPFILKDKITRGIKTFKCYICLFICLTTKAIHLEPVTSMSTEAFIATLRRFIARRGKPNHMYSDNGKNFVGAISELRELGHFLVKESTAISNAALNEDIRWHFIPPYSPNFGGLWEAGIKSTKFHLKRVMSNAMLTFEDFLTVLTQIEGILNSRPLSVLSSDPNDFQALTPAHFLIGRSIVSVADPDLRDVKTSRLGKFQHLQQLKQHFWTRWSKEYISELQQRTKWKIQQPSIKQDDIVILKQNNLAPSQWQLGRVIELHPGADNVTRVVSVKTTSGIVKRAVNTMCVLPLDEMC